MNRRIPTVADVEQITALTDPVVRNLQITYCYYELSSAFSERAGAGANWCTFATWASKQAGQTIRREDLTRELETRLRIQPEASKAIQKLVGLVKQLGARQHSDQIRHVIWDSVVVAALNRSSDAVSRGNRKVFMEIGREFARFLALCAPDTAYNADHLDQFLRELRPGDPPDGQYYLRQAFTAYYQSWFLNDPKQQAELRLLANLEIGYHEQNRLQPEIVESLTMMPLDAAALKKRLIELVFPADSWMARGRLFFLDLLGQLSPLERAIDNLIALVHQQVRLMVTEQLMTMTLPADVRLRLGQDLKASFPVSLRVITNPDLQELLLQIDPTADSLLDSGASDWADLADRIHFIADLFRCYHETTALFDAPFSPEQVAVLRQGKRPEGRL
ncbi:hypothetical protein ACFQ4C_11250 [Larkinella insperata]|uniref:Uncharacterized protein n=1 Tax=Larkinella insperata TaxID=332158 RepID=A0ABW3QA42_9BACT|nr:hypothetical protein [Larkinella insperata]